MLPGDGEGDVVGIDAVWRFMYCAVVFGVCLSLVLTE